MHWAVGSDWFALLILCPSYVSVDDGCLFESVLCYCYSAPCPIHFACQPLTVRIIRVLLVLLLDFRRINNAFETVGILFILLL